jgi:hypothetical protein
MMESWNGAHGALTVKDYYKNNDSYVSAQLVFRSHFNIPSNDPVLSAHAIKTWMKNFEETGSTLRKKIGSVKSVRTPDSVARVEGAVLYHGTPDHPICSRVISSFGGHLKSRVSQPSSPRNVQELKERIRGEVARIPVDMLLNVMSNLRTRLTECMNRNGGHLCDAIF